MAVLRSGRGASKTKPKGRSFKDIISEIGHHTELAKPRYADSTKKGNSFVWRRWTQFCQKTYEESSHLSSSDPIKAVKYHLNYAFVRAFLYWSCQESDFGSPNSLFTYAKTWRMAVIENVRCAVEPAIKLDMKNYIMDTLIDEFGIKDPS